MPLAEAAIVSFLETRAGIRATEAGLLAALSVQALTKFGRAGRESLRLMIEFQELWLRDLLRARYGAPREELANRDLEPEVRRDSSRTSRPPGSVGFQPFGREKTRRVKDFSRSSVTECSAATCQRVSQDSLPRPLELPRLC